MVQWQLARSGVQSIQLQCLGTPPYRGLPAPFAQGQPTTQLTACGCHQNIVHPTTLLSCFSREAMTLGNIPLNSDMAPTMICLLHRRWHAIQSGMTKLHLLWLYVSARQRKFTRTLATRVRRCWLTSALWLCSGEVSVQEDLCGHGLRRNDDQCIR